MKAEYKAYLVTALIVVVVLYAIANFTDVDMSSKLGLTSQKVA